MSDPWMEHPKLVAWFDDLEDVVTTAFVLTETQRAQVKALKAPRPLTWIMLARDTKGRDEMRTRLGEALGTVPVPVANDCNVLSGPRAFSVEEDTFEEDNGFSTVAVDYVDEGSVEAVRRELLSDADDYAASEDTGWFYAIMDGEFDPESGAPE